MAATMTLTFAITAPPPETESGARRQRRAIERTAQTVQRLVDHFDAQTLEQVSAEIEAALSVAETPPAPSAMVSALNGGREYPPQERQRLELSARLHSFERRQELLRDAYTASQVAKLLHTTRQTPHDRLQRGTLLAVLDRGAWRFPAWQFDPEGPDGVIRGLPQVLHALKVSPLAKISWFVRPNPYLAHRTPIEALRQGEVEHVPRVAEAVGAH